MATIANASERVAKQVEPVVEAMRQARQALIHTPTPLHVDETGARVAEKLHWIHVACTPLLTYLFVSVHRGGKAHQAMDILPNRTQVVVHDDYPAYFTYRLRHATCNAHHLRDLLFLFERYQQLWASQLAALLVEIKHTVEQAQLVGQTSLTAISSA